MGMHVRIKDFKIKKNKKKETNIHKAKIRRNIREKKKYIIKNKK